MSRQTEAASASPPACRIPPPNCLRNQVARRKKSLGPRRTLPTGAPRGRVVVHYQIDERAIGELVDVVRELKAQRTNEARQWEELVGFEVAEEIRRKSRLYAEGQYEGRIEGPKRSLPAYGKK